MQGSGPGAGSAGRGRSETVLTSLPTSGSELTGRDDELHRLLEEVRHHRVVSLVGVGGVGKTRLAAEAIGRLARERRRVGFVQLAEVIQPADVIDAIADQLAVVVVPGASPIKGLVYWLARAPTVLAVDNFEHVIDAAPDLAALVEQCPTLHVLVTSRRRLDIPDERTIVVAPFAESGDAPTPDAPAMKLFFERSRTVNATDAEIQTARRVVTAVGGLPLAVELAASRSAVLGVDVVDELLVSDLSLDGLMQHHASDDRQKSLRACIAWSVRGLDRAAQATFVRTGAFGGSFDLAALRALGGEPHRMAAGLATLVEHHLVDRLPGGEGRSRFVSLPPVRAFAQELLAGDADHDEVSAAHAEHFAHGAGEVRRCLERSGTDDAIALYRQDEANFNVAVASRHTTGDLRGASQIVADLAKVTMELGRDARLLAWFRELRRAATVAGVELTHEVQVWVAFADLLGCSPGSASEALQSLGDAIAQARAEADDAAVVVSLARIATSVTIHSDLARAIDATREGVELATRLDLRRSQAEFSLWRGMLEHVAGDAQSAFRHGMDALQIARELGDRRVATRVGLLFAPMDRADVPLSAMDDDPPVPTLDDCLDMAQASKSTIDELYVVMQLAIGAGLGGRDDALEHVAYGLSLAERTCSQSAEAVFLLALASAAFHAGDDAIGARLHAALRPEWAMLSTVLPPTALQHHIAVMERRRSADPVQFDATVAASVAPWAEVVAAASDYANGGAARRATGSLTAREHEVLLEMAAGRSNKEIAQVLGLRPKTVMHHCGAIYRKLGVSTRGQATATALRMGLLDSSRGD